MCYTGGLSLPGGLLAVNGKLPASALVSVTGVKVACNTANALKRAIAGTKTRITIAAPGGGYRSWSYQNAMYLASISGNAALKKKYNLNPNSSVALARPGQSSHGFGTRVDLQFNGSGRPTQAQINYMAKFGFTREFGAADPNHFKHNGVTAIAPLPKKAAPKPVVKPKPTAKPTEKPSPKPTSTPSASATPKPVEDTKKDEGKSVTETSIEGVDYSYSRPLPSQLKDANKEFVVRYITNPGPGNKGISQSEYDELKAKDIKVAVVWEGGAEDMLKGRSQGIADAKSAQRNLKAIDGLNDNLPVYFACDFDATPAHQDQINAYLGGVASVLGDARVGIYGSYFVLMRTRKAKKAAYFWQTYAWSGGKVLDDLNLHQYRNGVRLGQGEVDLTRALKKDYGQIGIKPPVPVVTAPITVNTAPVVLPTAQPVPTFETANGTIGGAPMYFRGDASSPIYVFLPYSGMKRRVTPSEWFIIKAAGATYLTHPQKIVDDIPLYA